MKNLVRKIFVVVALFAVIFSASTTNAKSLVDMDIDTFAAELQKNLADKFLQTSEFKRAYDLDMKDEKTGELVGLSWEATIAPKGGTSNGKDSISVLTGTDKKIVFVAVTIQKGATQEIICKNFWEAVLTTLNFTADERTQLLKGGTTNEEGFYSSKLQRSEKEIFSFGLGFFPSSGAVFSVFGMND